MARVKNSNVSGTSKKIRPAINPEAREQQLIALAVDLVEKRLIEGTASSQETTHFLKLATMKYKLGLEKDKREIELATAKKEVMVSQARSEELFAEAVKAFRGYSGQTVNDETEDDEYDEY